MAPTTSHCVFARRRLSLALSAPRHRNYRLYRLGQLASMLAQSMEYLAQSWLRHKLTHSPLLRGLTGLSQAIPTITLTRLGGVIADRADRRRIIVGAQSGVAGSYSLCFTASLSAVILRLFIRLQHELSAAFLGAPVAVLIGGALVAGSAMGIVLSKDKLTRLEPQPTPRCPEAPAPI